MKILFPPIFLGGWSEAKLQCSHLITWQDKRAAEYAAKVTNLWWLRIARLIARALITFIKNNQLILLSILKFDSIHTSARTGYYLLKHPELLRRIQERSSSVVWGRVDTWLLCNLTEARLHATDYSSASSTGLLDPFTLKWSAIMTSLFKIPVTMLPEVRPTGGDFGTISLFVSTFLINTAFADQQASLFGQCCFKQGAIKCTNGTDSFVDLNTGNRPYASKRRLYPLVAWKTAAETVYMLEGQSQNAGNIMDWIRDELKLVQTYAEIATLAESVDSAGGLWFLPAFTTGLTFPYWDSAAQGNIFGLSLHTMH